MRPSGQESQVAGEGGLSSTVRTGSVRHDGGMSVELLRRVRLLAWACAALALSALSMTLAALTLISIPLFGVWLGIPLLLGTVWVTRRVLGLHRRVYATLFGDELPAPYLVPDRAGVVPLLRTTLRDPATWRDLAWLLLDSTVGATLSVLGVVEGLLDLLLWFLPLGLSLRLAAWLAALLLGPTETSRLATRVSQLGRSRTETVDTQAAELRRIERDLHDGAQARLVSVGLTLALAEAQFDTDPTAARALMADARIASVTALTELSELVRGIHPPVLADRGLGGAVEALALTLPVGVEAQVDVPDRLPAAVESAAYFATSEVLTNAVKHSGAQHIHVSVVYRDGRLLIVVDDNGRGGADTDSGTGLRGVERRLSAFDGSLAIASPPGGPTRVEISLPSDTV